MPTSYLLRTNPNPNPKKSLRRNKTKPRRIQQPNSSRNNRQIRITDPFEGQYQCSPFAEPTQGATKIEVEHDMAAIYAGIVAVNAGLSAPPYVFNSKCAERAAKATKEGEERRKDMEIEKVMVREREREREEVRSEKERQNERMAKIRAIISASTNFEQQPKIRVKARVSKAPVAAADDDLSYRLKIKNPVNAEGVKVQKRYGTRASAVIDTENEPSPKALGTRVATRVDTMNEPTPNAPGPRATAKVDTGDNSAPKALRSREMSHDLDGTEAEEYCEIIPGLFPRRASRRAIHAMPTTRITVTPGNEGETLESIRLTSPKSLLLSTPAKDSDSENSVVELGPEDVKILVERNLFKSYGARWRRGGK